MMSAPDDSPSPKTGEAVFKQQGDEWVPVSLAIVAVVAREKLMSAVLPLPHGLKYASLRSIATATPDADEP